MKSKKLYVKYENAEPHLPEAVADSKVNLARMLGKDPNVVYSAFSHGHSTYAEVDDIEDEDG